MVGVAGATPTLPLHYQLFVRLSLLVTPTAHQKHGKPCSGHTNFGHNAPPMVLTPRHGVELGQAWVKKLKMTRTLQATQNDAFQTTDLSLSLGIFEACSFSEIYAVIFSDVLTCNVGVALNSIGVALFEAGVARTTPKVYKPSPLGLERIGRALYLLRVCVTEMVT